MICILYLPSECEVCGAVYRSTSGLRTHMWDKHGLGKKVKTYTCDTCGKAYHSKTTFEAHVALHKNVSINQTSLSMIMSSSRMS